MLLQIRRRDRRRLQASFRRGTSYPSWRLRFRPSSFRHITRIFPARRPVRLGTAAGFLACYCPLHLSDLGSAIRSRDISSHLRPLRGRYNTAPRGAAAAKYSSQPGRKPASVSCAIPCCRRKPTSPQPPDHRRAARPGSVGRPLLQRCGHHRGSRPREGGRGATSRRSCRMPDRGSRCGRSRGRPDKVLSAVRCPGSCCRSLAHRGVARPG